MDDSIKFARGIFFPSEYDILQYTLDEKSGTIKVAPRLDLQFIEERINPAEEHRIYLLSEYEKSLQVKDNSIDQNLDQPKIEDDKHLKELFEAVAEIERKKENFEEQMAVISQLAQKTVIPIQIQLIAATVAVDQLLKKQSDIVQELVNSQDVADKIAKWVTFVKQAIEHVIEIDKTEYQANLNALKKNMVYIVITPEFAFNRTFVFNEEREISSIPYDARAPLPQELGNKLKEALSKLVTAVPNTYEDEQEGKGES